MPRCVEYLERYEYFCKVCKNKGVVQDILINAEILLIRGYCLACEAGGTYKVVDIDILRREHEAAAREESAGAASRSNAANGRVTLPPPSQDVKTDNPPRRPRTGPKVNWKWELGRPSEEFDDPPADGLKKN
jgi:hypothetical protein